MAKSKKVESPELMTVDPVDQEVSNQIQLEEKLKSDFELDFKKILKPHIDGDRRILTRRSYKMSEDEVTIKEFNKMVRFYFDVAISHFPKIKEFKPFFIIDAEKLEINIKYKNDV